MLITKKKIVKPKVEVVKPIVLDPEHPINDTDCHGNFNKKQTLTIVDSDLTLCGTITGCGLMQLKGIIYYKGNKEQFLAGLKPIKDINVGAIICTLGQAHYTKEKMVLDLGFELLSEYHNYVHGKDYMQRMYILKL